MTIQTYEEVCAERDAAWIKHLGLVKNRDAEWIKTLQIDLERSNAERDHLAKLLRKEQNANEALTAERDALREQARELAAALMEMGKQLQARVESDGHTVWGASDVRAAEHGEPAWVCNARAAFGQARVALAAYKEAA